MRFNRALLGILAAILIAVFFTTLGMFVGRKTQKVAAAVPTVSGER